jgi:hypothetical protein
MSSNFKKRATLGLLLGIGAVGVTVTGCGEETYKVSRGTNEVPKPADPKQAARTEKANQAEKQLFTKSDKLK